MLCQGHKEQDKKKPSWWHYIRKQLFQRRTSEKSFSEDNYSQETDYKVADKEHAKSKDEWLGLDTSEDLAELTRRRPLSHEQFNHILSLLALDVWNTHICTTIHED